jgi:hypothetical protein
MPTYRAYRVDNHRHIHSATWLDASNDVEAKDLASELCEDGTPTVELWQATRLVDEIKCDDG